MADTRLESTAGTPSDTGAGSREIFSARDFYRLTYDGRRIRCYLRLLDPAQMAGAAPAPQELQAAVEEDCRRRGIVAPDSKAIATAIQAGEYGQDHLIAEGRDAVPGRDGVITYKFRTDLEEIRLVEDAAGRVDFRELGLIQNVTVGDVLAVATKPTQGKAGIDVFGKPVRPVAGQAARIRCNNNVVLSEDGLTATAAIDGYVYLDNMIVTVKPVYVVRGDVNFGVGNIKFNGTVWVLGSVLEDFYVHANGDVIVDGDVEKATVTAGGNVYVKGSIFGKEGTEVRAGQDIATRRAINTVLCADGDILIAEELNNCHVVAGHGVRLNGKERRLLGGTIVAYTEVYAGTIGSGTGLAKTRIELRLRPGLLERADAHEQRHAQLEAECARREGALAKLLALKEKLERLTGEQYGQVRTLMQEIQQLRDEQSDCTQEAAALRQLHAEQMDAMVIVEHTCYPGTTIAIRDVEMHVDRIASRCTFAREGDSIVQGTG